MSRRSREADPLDAAIAWVVRLSSGTATARDQQACDDWRRQDPAHEAAWQRTASLTRTLSGVPPALGMPVLARRRVSAGRRRVLGGLGLLGGATAAGWLLGGHDIAPGLLAAHRTGVGQRKHLVLADGSQVTLNTDSALDVHLDDSTRQLTLHRGELWLAVLPDPRVPARAFDILTRVGHLQTQAARFTARDHGQAVQVDVMEGTVRFRGKASAAEDRIAPGQSAWCTASGTARRVPVAPGVPGWTQGMLVANDMPLQDFLAELSRYRRGVLQCAPSVAALRISGAFPVDDIDRVLASLAQTLPVSVHTVTRYWTRVNAI